MPDDFCKDVFFVSESFETSRALPNCSALLFAYGPSYVWVELATLIVHEPIINQLRQQEKPVDPVT